MESALVEKSNVLDLINCVCFKLGIPKKISSLKEANVNLIKECFVKLCASGKLSDRFLDDLSTIKKILNTLSFSLGVSLAHIEPHLIISCDETALNDLFEVFSELISIKLQSAIEKTTVTENDLLHLMNFILEELNMNKKIANILEVDCWLFRDIFKHLSPSSIAATAFKENDEEGNYKALISNISDLIQIPLTHIDANLLAKKDHLMIWKFVEIIVGFREGYFSTKKLQELKMIEQELVDLANGVLKLFEFSNCIQDLNEVNDEFFLSLLEIHLGHRLGQIVRYPTSNKERIENMRHIIEVLSHKVLGTPLNHISPIDVMSGNTVTIRHLLEIFRDLTLCRVEAETYEKNVANKQKTKVDNKLAPEKKNKNLDYICGSCQKKAAEIKSKNEARFPTMEEVLMKYGPKKDGKKSDVCGKEKPRMYADDDSKSEISTFQLSQRFGDDIYEDSDMDDVEILRKGIKNMDLSQFAEETCKPYNEALNKTLQKEMTKTKEIQEKVCGLTASRADSYTPPSELQNMRYCRSIMKKHNIGQNLCTDCGPKTKPKKTDCRQDKDQSMKRVVGKLMTHLMEEYPSVELPEEIKKRICQTYYQKKRLDAKLVARSQARNKAVDQMCEAQEKEEQKLEMLKRDIITQERLKNLRERRNQQMRTKAVTRNRKILSQRLKKHCEEVQTARRSRDARKKSFCRQELQKMCKARLSLRKEMLAEERKRQKEERKEEARKQVEELESIENYYRDQFAMLNENLEKENAEKCLRDQEQAKLLREMKFEMRKNMEEEIEELQNKLLQGATKNRKKLIC